MTGGLAAVMNGPRPEVFDFDVLFWEAHVPQKAARHVLAVDFVFDFGALITTPAKCAHLMFITHISTLALIHNSQERKKTSSRPPLHTPPSVAPLGQEEVCRM